MLSALILRFAVLCHFAILLSDLLQCYSAVLCCCSLQCSCWWLVFSALLCFALLLLIAVQCWWLVLSALMCFALLLLLSAILFCYSAQCYSAVLLLVASAQCGVKRTRTEARHPASAYHHANNCCFLSHYLLFAVFYLGQRPHSTTKYTDRGVCLPSC